MKSENKFQWRSFISFFLFFSFFIIFISGIILYIAPQGRVAYWTSWQLVGFTKDTWQAIHTVFSYVFAIFAIIHLFSINWKVFWLYVKKKTKTGLNKGKELLIATVLTLILFVGTTVNIQPFKGVTDFANWVGKRWTIGIEVPPIPHAELLPLDEAGPKLFSVPGEKLMQILKEEGIKVETIHQNLMEIGKANKLSPSDLFNLLKKHVEPTFFQKQKNKPN